MNKEERWKLFLKTCEYPFARLDMSPREFREEHQYYIKNFDSVFNGTYKSLWQQKNE